MGTAFSFLLPANGTIPLSAMLALKANTGLPHSIRATRTERCTFSVIRAAPADPMEVGFTGSLSVLFRINRIIFNPGLSYLSIQEFPFIGLVQNA